MSDIEKKRAELIGNIEKATKALESAKAEYKEFCKENPAKAPKQPTLHELRLMREKLGEKSDEAHAKVNQAQAKRVERNKTVQAAKEK